MAREGNSYGWQQRDNGIRQGYGYNRAPGQAFAQPFERYGETRTEQGYNRGYRSPESGYARPATPQQLAYNHFPQPVGRPQTYGSRPQPYSSWPEQNARSGYGTGFTNRPPESYAGRSGLAYAAPSQPYRPQAPQYGRGDFGGRQYGAYSGSAAKPEHSGGFHLFGHGRQSDNFNGGGRAPKSFNYGGHEPKSFGKEKMPKERHSGGGHSGGHSSGHRGFGHFF
jgi:hypothetical protein